MSTINADRWRRRWLVIKLSLFASVGLGTGLFFISPELAKEIASSISLISVSITGLASAYIGGAVFDDKKKS